MDTVTVDDMQRNLLAYLERVEAGETLPVTKAGKPLAEIKPVTQSSSKQRPFGLCRGELATPDDFDALLSDAVIEDFEAP
ncbi:MAG TPA: type II toxin-antitoxin system prevent-host-death family antitoxin [Chthonomonadaceae bacterium]|nr:type II toxin-antitoxin system prevent-host-death family antitoxin [Chthonomonadaceae bacterium]